jgi:hypothetical protein
LDYKKRRAEHGPIHIDGAIVEWDESFKFLGVHITTVLKRAKRLFPLRRVKRFSMGPSDYSTAAPLRAS